ncbi:MAG: VWA domain-containing protein, partial [Candidatus Dadabacteria bacterium]
LDVSESVDTSYGELLIEKLRKIKKNALKKGENIKFTIIPFAVKAGNETSFSNKGFKFFKQNFSFSKEGTNLEEAVKALEKRGVRKALLLSDGQINKGSFSKALNILRDSQIKLYPLVERSAEKEEGIKFIKLYAPSTAKVKERVKVRVVVANKSSDGGKDAEVVFYQDGKEVKRERAVISPNTFEIFYFQSLPLKEGITQLKAVVKSLEEKGKEEARTVYLSVPRKDKILILTTNIAEAKYLRRALKEAGYESKVSLTREVRDPSELSNYKVVILNNVPRAGLAAGFDKGLKEYVKKGGGLIVVGGTKSFGLGGWKGSYLEDALPVLMLPPKRVLKRLNVAVILVIDKSRSMRSAQRLEYAIAAAGEVIRNLKADDYVGVIAFDTTPYEVVRIGKLSLIREAALDMIRRVYPGNSTNPFPALDEARRRLKSVPAGRKHVIMLTDGKIPDEGPHYYALVDKLRLSGITLSTVLIGSEAGQRFLRELAQRGGGAFYHTESGSALPRIFLQDVKVATGKTRLREAEQFNVADGPYRRTYLSMRTFPPVRGFVQTKAKERGRVILKVQGSQNSFPLLAAWSYGAGKSVVFTSDVTSRWGVYWLSWSKLYKFWDEVVRTAGLIPKGGSKAGLDLSYEVTGEDLRIKLFQYSGKPLNSVFFKIKTPQGKEVVIDGKRDGIGKYYGLLSIFQGGKYTVSIYPSAPSENAKELFKKVFEIPNDLFLEQRNNEVNIKILTKVAEESKGSINPSISEILEGARGSRVKFYKELYPLIIALAVLMFLLEVMLRLRSSVRGSSSAVSE